MKADRTIERSYLRQRHLLIAQYETVKSGTTRSRPKADIAGFHGDKPVGYNVNASQAGRGAK